MPVHYVDFCVFVCVFVCVCVCVCACVHTCVCMCVCVRDSYFQLFLRNFITVRFAHGTASVSARGLGVGPGSMHNMAFSHVVTEGLIDDMIALIDTYIHETGRS